MQLLIALGLGVISAFAFQPVGFWPLMPLAFAGLFELLARAPTQRRAIGIGWWFAVGQFCVGLNWIATAFTFQAAMPAWLGWVAVVALSLYLAIYPMLATGLAWRIGRDRPAVMVFAFAGAWIVNEWLRATMFTGFAWNPVGVILVDSRLLDASRGIGTYGLGGLVVLSGGALWLAWRRAFRPAAITAAAVLTFMLVPAAALQPKGNPRPIRIVQPNIGQDVKWSPGFAAASNAKLNSLSRPREHRQELIFWPEAAVTDPLSDSRPGAGPYIQQERTQATTAVVSRDVLLTGGIALRSKDGRDVDSVANSVFVLGPGGRFIGRYDKAHLVPYGEYLPMRPILTAIGLSRLAPGDRDFDAGAGPTSLTLPEGWGKAGFQLCYEIIFSGHVVDRANRPDFLFNPSNDAWFGRWGPPQHLAQARLRAAEEGVPVIRSTPTGISALVDARGQIIESLPWHRAGIIWADLPRPAAVASPFALYGNSIPLLLALGLLIAAIALRRVRR